MAISKKIKITIAASIIFAVAIIVAMICAMLYIFVKSEKINDKMADEIATVFEKYEKAENLAIISSHYVDYNEQYISLNKRVNNHNQIIVSTEGLYFAEIHEENIYSYRLNILVRNLTGGNEELLYEETNIRIRPTIRVFEKKFYFLYKNKQKKWVTCCFNIEDNSIYNYSIDERIDLDGIIKEEQMRSYQLVVNISDDEKSFEINNIANGKTVIIDDAFINKSSFCDEMLILDYKPYKVFFSNSHIILCYYLGKNGKYLSSICYEYSLFDNDLIFVYFSKNKISDNVRYELI